MSFFSRGPHLPKSGASVPEGLSPREPDSLPALLHQRDLALLIILVILTVPELRGMQFAGAAVFFYWFLAFLTFQLPSIWVFGWLTRQAPTHVPIFLWILHLLHERWRSVLLFLMWWSGVLIIVPALGICVSLLQLYSPSWFSTVPAQSLAFAVLLILATFFTSLPLRLFRIVLWIGGLLYLAAFALLGFAGLVSLIHSGSAPGTLPHPTLPAHFSWTLFGLALLAQIGLNTPLLLDGEMRGTQRFLRSSTSYLWWGGLGVLLILLLITESWIIFNPTMHVMPSGLFLRIGLVLGPGAVPMAELLFFLGSFGCVLAYLFLFSRAFLLVARQGYLPRPLARLNRSGTPVRAILTQSALILCTAVLFLVVAPAVLTAFLPVVVLNEWNTGDQFGLFASIAGSLWCLLTALLFGFALWLCVKKHRSPRENQGQRLIVLGMSLSGCLTSLFCAIAPLLPTWPALFFSTTRWFPMVSLGIACSLAVAWVISELPRLSALARAKARSLAREKELREALQRANEELNRLYREQEQAALTDSVTGLLNHRAFLQRLDEAIARGQTEASRFLLVFLDLDHFKAINDTWGHLAGDAVLRQVAERLRQALRPGDVAARYGGEEFALILDGVTITHAREEGERLRRIMQSSPWSVPGAGEATTGISVTASIGVAAYGMHGTQRNQLIEQADQAMYQAKLDGRDCVRVAGE